MSIGKEEVLEVLSDFRIRSIRFMVGPINVNVNEYDRVADFIESGAIEIKETKSQKYYRPQTNTLFLIDGNTTTDVNVRSGVLHECTHIIADINKVRMSRLHDEAAAYLAQFTFLRLLDPTVEAPPIRGDPISDLMRTGISFVEQYGLGQASGFGAVISSSDITTLSRLVQRNPDYANLRDGDQLAADGVALSERQALAHAANQLARLADKTKYEAWLGKILSDAQSGGAKKSSAYALLHHHFLIVYQPVATVFLHRFSAARKDDRLSERFQIAFTAQEKQELLAALREPKPPG